MFKDAYVKALKNENARLNQHIKTLQHLNRQYASEFAKLRTAQQATPAPKEKRKKRVVTKAMQVFTGYRQLDVNGHAHYVCNLMASMTMNNIRPLKGLERLRLRGDFDENNVPAERLLNEDLFIMKSEKQAYAHPAGVAWIRRLKNQGAFYGCLMTGTGTKKKGTK